MDLKHQASASTSIKSAIEVQDDRIKHDIFNDKPDLSLKAIRKYFATRFSTLFDIPVLKSEERWYEIINPIPGLKSMSKQDYNFYFLGFLAWSVDSMDFFCVSVSAPDIAKTLNVSITKVTWGVTLVLMFRSVGATIFGLISDYYGRKWPFIVVCFLFIIIEIATGFVKTYPQFLAVRAIFGILMGAMYPIASVTALENQPPKAKSILSGLFLPGYNLGYIFAMIFYRAFENSYKPGEGWRALFWFSSVGGFLLMIWRFFVPESEAFLRLKQSKKILKSHGQITGKGLFKSFDKSILITIRTEWVLFIYLVILMGIFNFTTHGSQDLYVTMLTNQYGISLNQKTVIIVVCNLGGIVGGITLGQLSELFGRRLTILIGTIGAGAFLYPSFYNSKQNYPAYFFLNFFVMGNFGVVPIHLLELVNATHRTFLSGVVYQLGNLASSAASTIEAKLGSNFPIKGGKPGAYNYGKVMCIFSGAIFAAMLVAIILGPENFHRDLKIHTDITDEPLEDDEYDEDYSEEHHSIEKMKVGVEHREEV
ncbi:major facilitator superfamily domain-containing protein [Scheffersomyces coipomensis]|uniref:major facilitator superfamily domain-containing protein n=1 Tax=Scheffersomyces coipomensis TaxID=1788519 RepID=UPI00315DC32B